MWHKIVLCALLCSLPFWLPKGFKRWTHSFRLAKCCVHYRDVPEWDTEDPDESVKACLREPFSYFSKGRQCYVFLSQDQKYVFKLFRFDHCRIPFMQKLEKGVRKIFQKKMMKGCEPAERNFNSCMLAYRLAKKQTGLVYVHLNPKQSDLPLVTIKDRIGRKFKIDPAKYRFILQKRAEPLFQSFCKEKLFILLDELSQIGLVNLDLTWKKNFGFLDGEAVQIDVGCFTYCPEKALANAQHYKSQVEEWLQQKSPL